MTPRRKKSHAWVYMIWGINGLALASFIGFLVFTRTDLHVSAAVEVTDTPRPGRNHRKNFLPQVFSCPH
jgi:hypothetical protein